MAEKGSPRYYEELLDTIYRVVLSLYITSLVAFWAIWVFSHHGYAGAWYVLLACGFILMAGYVAVYFTNLPDYLSRRYQVRSRT